MPQKTRVFSAWVRIPSKRLVFFLCTYCEAFYVRKGGGVFLRGSLIKCLTRNPGVLGSSRTGSSDFFFVGVSFDKTLKSPSLVQVKPRKDMNKVRYRRDMTEILLKAARNTIQSFNQSMFAR